MASPRNEPPAVELYDAQIWESRNSEGRVLYEARTTTKHAPCRVRLTPYPDLNDARTEDSNGFTVEACLENLEWFITHQTGKPCRARHLSFMLGAERSLQHKLDALDALAAADAITRVHAQTMSDYWRVLYAKGAVNHDDVDHGTV